MGELGTVRFTDPELYQGAVHPARVELLVTAKGDFNATLTRLEMPRLWLQRGRESLPRVASATVRADRLALFFLTDKDQGSTYHSGRALAFGEIVASAAGSTQHLRTDGPSQWATFSMKRDDLGAAGHALAGHDLIERSVTSYLRPPLQTMSRLLRLHHAAEQLAEGQSDVLAQPEAVRALEHDLLHAMMMCLTENAPIKMGCGALRHKAIITRFEEFLATNFDQPIYLAQICAAIGASERTLRKSCMEHLGMGPIRYLWLRRMHLAHRALIQVSPGTTTVTEIATANGFWELGRFAVDYRTLFGEAPSSSLYRAPGKLRTHQNSPFAFAHSGVHRRPCAGYREPKGLAKLASLNKPRVK
jgi:AraC-like DNA-binding protein